MSAFLHSPFTIGVCLLLLFAWVTMLTAIFWPPKIPKRDDHHDARF
jgi:hypothetical protein